MVSQPLPDPEQSDADQLAAAADQAIAVCGGDARETIKALIVANHFLETELEKLRAAASAGYARLPVIGKIGMISDYQHVQGGKMFNRKIASAVLLTAFLVCISGLQSIADPVQPLRSSIVPQAGAEDVSKSLVGTWRVASF